ncbi:MAG: HD domain-containing protein [Cytophagales bacterium]|nr:HD domain-containing protein [Cytophagales bacterium]
MNIGSKIKNLEILQTIGSIADDNKLEAYVIGGFVRDLLLGRDNYDIDIMCVGSGIFLADKVAKELNCMNVAVYANFGTAMIKHDNIQLEFVGARKESYDRSSRKPIVENGTFEDDQLRRDFTINTLAISINKNTFGELKTITSGIEDLKNKIIRTPVDGDKTFSDDPLRMLRAIRFATQISFTIEQNTFEAIKRQRERIKIISYERIRDEINKILLSPKPSVGLMLLSECGLLGIIMPFIENLKGKLQIGRFSHKDIFFHTLQVLDNVATMSDSLLLRWAAILHDIAKPQTKRFDTEHGFSFHGHEELGARMVKDIFTTFKLSKESAQYVSRLVRLHLRPIVIAQDEVSDAGVRRLVAEAGEGFDDLMRLCRADITSHNPVKIIQYLNNFDKVETKVKDILKKDYIRTLQPVITGEMIMKELHLQPGPTVGRIKKKLKEAILNGSVNNTLSELHDYMMEIIKNFNIK